MSEGSFIARPITRREAMKSNAVASVGVIGTTGVRVFVKVDEPTTIEDTLNHFDHVAKLVGAEHVGVGSDSDLQGYDKMPPKENEQLRAGERMFDLAASLIRREYSDSDIELLLGGNFKRALMAIWTVTTEK